MLKKITLIIWSLMIMTIVNTGSTQAADPQNTLYLDLDKGRVTIEMLPDIAPKHVNQIKTLVKDGFYDGIVWHRVIDGFMAQTGDPTGTGMGASDLSDIPAEFSDYQYKRGTVGMARSQSPDSANSQFFICFTDTGCSFLTGQYTVWGQVTDGMALIDQLAQGEPPANPDKIVKMQIAADLVTNAASEESASESHPVSTDEMIEETISESSLEEAAE